MQKKANRASEKQQQIKMGEKNNNKAKQSRTRSKAINNTITIEHRRNLLDQGWGLGIGMGGGDGREEKGYGFWRVGVKKKRVGHMQTDR